MRNISIGINVKLRLIITFIILSLHFSVRGYESHQDIDGYNIIDLTVDTMPNLKTARTGHVTLCIDGELTVFGGHSDGFLPLNTAEYLHDGVWHTVTLAYPHDQGTAIKLRSGDVFLSGGFREPLGIGQLFSAELYDPKTHTSHGFGCMYKKRAFLNAVEMADGQVMITGNWYADDCIEMFENVFDPFLTNAIGVKPTSFARANPYILKISEDDVIIFSSFGNMGEQVDCSIVDRLKGPAYHEPLLETWHPLNRVETLRSDNHFIGNEDEGIYEWLLPLENVETREVAIARVKGTDNESEYPAFELLTMRQPLPKILDNNLISYNSLVCDRDRGIAYLIGDDNEARIYVFAIHYDSPDSEPLTIYRTGPQSIIAASNTPVLTPEGDLILAGGHLINNFTPSSTVIRLPVGPEKSAVTDNTHISNNRWWLWAVIIGLIAWAIVMIILNESKRNEVSEPIVIIPNENATDGKEGVAVEDVLDDSELKDNSLPDLFYRIEQLMQNEQLYLDANLRVSDIATRMKSNTAYVSAAINSQRGCSFTQYLTSYRILYAQNLMRQNPDKKVSDISTISGFTTDSTFFRAFRISTGMTPKEWLATIRNERRSSGGVNSDE